MAEHQIVVVGAGIGGLVSALRLAHQGLDVTVVEAAEGPGGKLRQLVVDGAPIDSGPTVFTLRWVFDELLASVGTSLEVELRIRKLPVLARHWWEDGGTLDLFADPARSFDAVANFAGLAEARRFQGFCTQAQALYRTLERPYMRAAAPSMVGLSMGLGLRGMGVLASIGPLHSLWRSLGKHFTDVRLRQLFARYATYTGSSPWQAPATLMLIAQVELDGVWSIDGGMHALARCLERLARERGATFRYRSACERIDVQAGRVRGVTLASGETLPADSIVFNGDAAALRQGLLGDGARRAAHRRARSPPSPGPSTRPRAGWRWTGTTCSSAPTTPASSPTSSSTAACHKRPRCTCARKTGARANPSPKAANACCASSTRRPPATRTRSPRRPSNDAKPPAFPCCAVVA